MICMLFPLSYIYAQFLRDAKAGKMHYLQAIDEFLNFTNELEQNYRLSGAVISQDSFDNF